MNKRRTLQGIVTKKSGINTIKVRVENKKQHKLYGKIVSTHKQYLVHTTKADEFNPGDEVIIAETRPLSKKKNWELIQLVNKSE
jgi:small subunit ribosomal protein S17